MRVEDVAKLASEVTHRKRELHTALESMRVAREHAESASAAKTTFLGLVSHELRTPLTTLQLQLDRLRDRDLGTLAPEQKSALDGMAAATRRLIDLVESLLHYARIQSGRLTVNAETFDATQSVREVTEELEPRARARGLSLELTVAPDLPPISTDPELYRLITVNLVSNALKFTERGKVEVLLDAPAAGHRLRVQDSGVGISAADRARIFEPFEQLEGARRKHVPGVGLGLTITLQMVEAVGGTISVDSEPGKGSVFTVLFPKSA